MLPQDETVVIAISDCRIIVCRKRELPDGSLTFECASNTDELEADAIQVVAADGRPFVSGQHYPCPEDLAGRARWN